MPTHLEIRSLVRRALSKPFVHITLILLSGFIAYSNTFNVPFFFDDNRFIVDNHLIKNLNNLWPPTGTRWFGSLTFALNFAAGGLNVSGYHYVNLAIHLITSLMVYQLVILTFQTPLIHAEDHVNSTDTQTTSLSALLTALLFVSHPVHTQAVTYIVQRFASLATLLFIASVLCYVKARQAFVRSAPSKMTCRLRSLFWYGASFVCAVLAMKTKEIAFTLPLILIMYEFAFFPRRGPVERMSFLIPIALTLLIVPYTLLETEAGGLSVISRAADISRHDYLLTQFRVIVTYLRLLLLPVNQMFDHDYPIFRTVSDPSVYLSFTLLVILIIASAMLLVMGGRGKLLPIWRIAGFAGLWFFITLSVESSIIPITDVMFEHRLYLPSIGFFMAVVVTCTTIMGRLGTYYPKSTSIAAAATVFILVALPVATHSRNQVWQSESAIWEDVAAKNPKNARAQAMIGVMLVESGKIDQAIDHFKTALRLKPDYADANICLGSAYTEKGMIEEGYQQYLKALELGTMDFESRSHLMKVIGNYNLKKGLPDLAIYYYQTAISLTPNVADIHFNLGQAYKAKDRTAEATAEFTKALELNPNRFGSVLDN
jgi:protein O-mannosyl-transferase